MTSNNPNSAMTERDGEAFLADLDSALAGRAPTGPHAKLAQFGAALAAEVAPAEPAPEQRQPEQAAAVTRLDRKLWRYKIGVLDVAALVALSVVLTLVAKSYLTPPAVKQNSSMKTVGGDDEKPTVKDKPENEEPYIVPRVLDPLTVELQRKVSPTFNATPFIDVVTFIRRECQIMMILDPKAVVNGLDKAPITLNARDMEAGVLLKWAARMARAEYEFKDGAIYISTNLEPEPELELYDVRDLKCGPQLPQLIEQKLLPNDYADKALFSIDFNGGNLVVMNRPEGHQRIAMLLRGMRAAKKSPGIKINVTERETPAWQKELQQKLKKKVSFEFTDTPFADAVDSVAVKAGVNVVIDPRMTTESISLKGSDLEAKVALEWLCKMAGISYRLKDQVAYISLHNNPLEYLEFRIYNIDDILAKRGTESSGLAELIRNRIRPDMWDAATGSSIEEIYGMLIVRQQPEILAKIEQLLSAFRAQGDEPKPGPNEAKSR